MTQYTEVETKWQPFCRRHFQIPFLAWILLHWYKIPIRFVHKVSINNTPSLVQIITRQWSGTQYKKRLSTLKTSRIFFKQGCTIAVHSAASLNYQKLVLAQFTTDMCFPLPTPPPMASFWISQTHFEGWLATRLFVQQLVPLAIMKISKSTSQKTNNA